MISTSIRSRIVRKVIRALVFRKRSRATLISILLQEHFHEILSAIIVTDSKGRLDDGSKHRLSALTTMMCSNHQVREFTNEAAPWQVRYVGDGKIKVIIGAGPQEYPGWLATDINILNITQDSAWKNLFAPQSIDNILAEHVVEHLTLDEVYGVLGHAKKYLKLGGIFRIAVPDAFHPSRYYYNLVKPGGWETPHEHKLFFDHEMLRRIAVEAGYTIRPLEYFDEDGIFHKEPFSREDGVIQRCAEHNCGLDLSDEKVMEMFYSTIPQHLRHQFYDRKMTYTSLIVDLIK